MNSILTSKNTSLSKEEIAELLNKSALFVDGSKRLDTEEAVFDYFNFCCSGISEKIKLMAGVKSLFPTEKELLELVERDIKASVSPKEKKFIESKLKKKFVKVLSLVVRELVENIHNNKGYEEFCEKSGIESSKPTTQPGG